MVNCSSLFRTILKVNRVRSNAYLAFSMLNSWAWASL